ncbi:hypothetical protein DKP78_23015, partial [Enterococcus faecium]
MHVLAKYVLILQVIILLVASSQALICRSCDVVKCTEPTNCKGGLVPGVCMCCKVCAKLSNEKCGGPFGLGG